MRVFFITGASRGLGEALVAAVLKRSKVDRVMGFARGVSPIVASDRYRYCAIDLARDSSKLPLPAHGDTFLQGATQLVLINAAATTHPFGEFTSKSLGELAPMFQLNVFSPLMLTRKVVDLGIASGLVVKVLQISSAAAAYPIAGMGAYCASKAALELYSHSLHAELMKSTSVPVSILSVRPGMVESAMQVELRESSTLPSETQTMFQELKRESRAPTLVAEQILARFVDVEVEGGRAYDVFPESVEGS